MWEIGYRGKMGTQHNYVFDIIGTIDEIEASQTPESVFDLLFSYLSKLGFQNASIGQVFNPALAAYKYASRTGKKILDEGRDFNLIKGLAVPVKIPFKPTGVISLGYEDLKLSDSEIAAVQLVCIHAYTHILSLLDPAMIAPAFTLTERESEVLHFAAAGKTNWEIGTILGISEQVAKEHMANISRKLGSSNRAHSVTIGIRTGAILP